MGSSGDIRWILFSTTNRSEMLRPRLSSALRIMSEPGAESSCLNNGESRSTSLRAQSQIPKWAKTISNPNSVFLLGIRDVTRPVYSNWLRQGSAKFSYHDEAQNSNFWRVGLWGFRTPAPSPAASQCGNWPRHGQ